MKYIDHRDWASADKPGVKQAGELSRDEFVVKLIEAYVIAPVQSGAKILNAFEDIFIDLFKHYNEIQETLAENDPTEPPADLGAEATDDVKTYEDTVESPEETEESEEEKQNEF